MYNLLKQYNALLEVDSMSPAQRTISLRGVFNRDIQNNKNSHFEKRKSIQFLRKEWTNWKCYLAFNDKGS